MFQASCQRLAFHGRQELLLLASGRGFIVSSSTLTISTCTGAAGFHTYEENGPLPAPLWQSICEHFATQGIKARAYRQVSSSQKGTSPKATLRNSCTIFGTQSPHSGKATSFKNPFPLLTSPLSFTQGQRPDGGQPRLAGEAPHRDVRV